MKKRVLSVIMAAALVGTMLAGCGSNSSDSESDSSTAAESTASAGEEKKELKYGKSFGQYTILFEEAVKPILEEEGYTLEAVEVDDVIQNDTALMDGDVDSPNEWRVWPKA